MTLNPRSLDPAVEIELPVSLSERFRVERLLGRTEHRATFSGRERATRRRVTISTTFGGTLPAGLLLRLEHEATLLKGVRDAGFSELLESVKEPDRLILVSEYVPGTSVKDLLKGSGRLGFEVVLDLALHVARALDELHQRGIRHRDIKPSNILRSDSRSGKRFLLVNLCHTRIWNAESVRRDELADTVYYLSPEQAGSIDQDIGPPSDLYALGAVLFECLTGKPPFTGASTGEILLQHMTVPVPNLRSHAIDVPRPFDELIQRLLRKDPRERYQTAAAVLKDSREIRAALDRGEADAPIVIGASDARCTLTEPAFVARKRELSEFDRRIVETAEGKGGTIFLEGESGSGKTRLLSEISQIAAHLGFMVLRGQGSKDVGQFSFSLLNGIADGYVVAARTDEPLRLRIQETLVPDASSLTAAFPQLQSMLRTQSDDSLAPEAFVETRALQSMDRFLRALGSSDRPCVIVLDDCQWADEITFKLLHRWQNRCTAETPLFVLLVVAFRAEEVGKTHTLRTLMDEATHVRLAGLSRDDVRLLAESMAGPLPSEASELVVRLAHGSPFMASAVLRGLVESGALVSQPGGWRIDPVRMTDCQSSARAAVFLSRRISLLAPSTVDILKTGAVLGKEFELDVVAQLTGSAIAKVIESLDEARQRNLIWIRPDESRCVFVHDKIRETLLEQLPDEVRRRIHLKAAHHFQRLDSLRVVDLAFHFDAAGESKSALPHALEAARQARAQHSLAIAEQQYSIALRGVDGAGIETQLEVEEGLGDVLMLQGKYETAAEHFETAAAIATQIVSVARIRSKLAELAFKRGDIEQAIADYEAALCLIDSPPPKRRWAYAFLLSREGLIQLLHTLSPRLFVHRLGRAPDETERLALRLYSGLAHGYWYARGKYLSLWAHLRGLNLGERFAPSLELAQVYAEHAPCMTLIPLFGRAEQYAEKSVQIRKSIGDVWGHGQSLTYYGIALYAASRFEECIQKSREAIRLLERMGDYWQVHMARYQIAASLYHLGDFEGAVAEAEKNHASGLELGDLQASGIILDVWARAGSVAHETLRVELERDRFDAQGIAQVLLAQGVELIKDDKLEEAASVLCNAIDTARKTSVNNAYSIPCATWYVVALRKQAERCAPHAFARRRRKLRKGIKAAKKARRAARICKNDLAHVLREYGLLLAMAGRSRRAKRSFELSLHWASIHKARYEFAQTLYAFGQVGQAYGWQQAEQNMAEGQRLLSAILAESEKRHGGDTLTHSSTSLSLVDRFDTVLESGRRIASALTEEEAFAQAHDAALRLLRAEQSKIIRVAEPPNLGFEIVIGEDDRPPLRIALRQAICSGRTIVVSDGSVGKAGSTELAGQASVLCAPIHVRGRVAACIQVSHDHIRDMFGPVEQRLAEFIAAIAGAACENAEGFSQLQALNETLEERVQERTAAAEARASELAESNKNLERVAHELRQTEEQLRLAIKEAQSANEAKSQFLASMSHEIRTPMNGILGMTELALKTSPTPQLQSCLSVVKQSGEALMTLLNDILDLSKIEAGRMELEEIGFELRAVVENAVQLLSASAHQKQLELVCRVAAETPSVVVGDPNRLRQIIVNLLGNAIKFTETGDVLVEVWPEQKDGSDLVHFAVTDTGIGIPPDRQRMIFEAFRQSDSSMTRRYGGTGLGLSISNTLVELMKGDIWLESVPDEGSTFHFTIPLKSAPPPADVPTTSPLRGVPVLLVSAHPAGRRAYGELLASFGCQFTLAADLADVSRHPRPGQAVLIIDQPAGVPVDARAEKYSCPIVLLACPHDAPGIALPCVNKPVTRAELQAKVLEALSQRPETGPRQETAPPRDGTGLRILLADDSPVNQEVAVGLLELRGHQVHVVNNGLEVLAALDTQPFDVILMDLEMPEMDGFEATTIIRGRDEHTGVCLPIIAMTAHAIHDSRQRCEAAGMNGYISKPVDPDELFSAIEGAVGQPSSV